MKLSDSKTELARRLNKVVYQDGNRVVKVFNDQKPASDVFNEALNTCLLYTSPSPRDRQKSRMPSSA